MRSPPSDPIRTPQGLERALHELGFDLFQWGNMSQLPDELRELLGAPPGAQLLLTGNTKHLWPIFTRAAEELRLPSTDPLDAYTELTHQALLKRVRAGHVELQPYALHFTHQTEPVIPFLRVASALGFCWLGPGQFGVHAQYGPWFGLRALYTFPPGLFQEHDALPASSQAGLNSKRTSASPQSLKSPCQSCAAPCEAALKDVLSLRPSWCRESIAATYSKWVHVRDVCPEGREHRYSAAQLRFHYGVSSLDAARAETAEACHVPPLELQRPLKPAP